MPIKMDQLAYRLRKAFTLSPAHKWPSRRFVRDCAVQNCRTNKQNRRTVADTRNTKTETISPALLQGILKYE